MTRHDCLVFILVCNSSRTSALSLLQVNVHSDTRQERGPSAAQDIYVWAVGNATQAGGLVTAPSITHKNNAPEFLPATRKADTNGMPPATLPVTRIHEGEGFRQKWPEFHIVIPSAKLAFCHIPKVASKQFAWMFNRANDIDTTKDFFQKFLLSTPERQGVDEKTITKANGWKFAYFTRDPLERYLSAFGSKCLPNIQGEVEGDGADCQGKVFRESTPKEDIIKAFEKRVMKEAEAGKPSDNWHWRRQTDQMAEYCGNMFTPKTADFIGTLNKDMNAQVRQMFQMTNMSHAQASALADEFFPKRSIQGHHSDMSKQEFFSNPEVVRALEKLYGPDYKKLELHPFRIWH